ncbi:MAG: hypothetical protein ACUVRG_00315 [Ignavibacterium sp.]|uniref:hypothetical protein n=1 Tax=Ignavibacterium sp. TaxID=2651167 RepID=UPI00404AA451
MPLIEIINITLLAFSVGLLALMGISYLVYRYRDSNYKQASYSKQNLVKITSKEIKVSDSSKSNNKKSPRKVSRYQIVNTYSRTKNFETKTPATEKFIVINKTAPSLKKTHSPKFIYLVTSTVNK